MQHFPNIIVKNGGKLHERLANVWWHERDQWILWLPVCLGVGIASYFSFTFEPERLALSLLTLLSWSITWLLRKRMSWKMISIVVSLILSGVCLASMRTYSVQAPVLQKETGVVSVLGTLEAIEPRDKGVRVWISQPEFPKDNMAQFQQIRLNMYTKLNGAEVGDSVSFRAKLMPPPHPVLPGGYDFSRYAYFQEIGAVGYTLSDMQVVEKKTSFSWKRSVQVIRQHIHQSIQNASESDRGQIASALLVGIRTGIAQEDVDAMRAAGLAHLLAISGMHLGILAGIFFFGLRIILSCFPSIALVYPIKKWSAIIAIIGSGVYLVLCGAPVSAQRAFVMTSLLLLAVVMDRQATPLRSVGFAAILVMVIAPEMVLSPGFQMSFAAATMLIASYQWYGEHLRYSYRETPAYQRALFFVGNIISSSLFASLATTPFAVYHFHHASTVGVFANVIAIPITTFWIMPMGILSVLLMPLSLEVVPLTVMGWGIEVLLSVAYYASSLPYASFYSVYLSDLALVWIVLGGLWLCLWDGRIRYLGVGGMLIGLIINHKPVLPDMIVYDDPKRFYAVSHEDRLFFSSQKKGSFAKEITMERYGIASDKDITQLPIHQCDSHGCVVDKANEQVLIAFDQQAMYEACYHPYHTIINFSWLKYSCSEKDRAPKVISIWQLKREGTHMFFFDKNKVSLMTTAAMLGKRPWYRW